MGYQSPVDELVKTVIMCYAEAVLVDEMSRRSLLQLRCFCEVSPTFAPSLASPARTITRFHASISRKLSENHAKGEASALQKAQFGPKTRLALLMLNSYWLVARNKVMR